MLIARYEERGSYPKPRSWANCDEFGPPYRGKNWYGGSNSSQLAQLLGFGYEPRSSYLAINVIIMVFITTPPRSQRVPWMPPTPM